MTAAMRAPNVIDFEPRRGRPSRQTLAYLQRRLDEARMELMSRRFEAVTHVEKLRPVARRLFLVARESGPEAMQLVAEFQHELTSYSAKWDDSDGAA